ncbi:hydantoinase B/oxoprolinase family protein [Alphaproteobacteria bacterium KMM 3653]|uniref:Hydantoinase B/oxoprolinase family protein n=1 Tax=Harenicola maris TaxID=2841044 RepID=A0AAP2G8F8_9RHOB|nr:hydantoinase B/oxoprolinase family protein [Harenicola maris]
MSEPLDGLRFQVLWSRLISVADEIATTLVKTAFSLIVRDNHDYACALYDSRGVMLAQSTQCTPGQAGSTPSVMRDMLNVYPPETLNDGDVLICNDPWIGAGHAPDVFIATPIFHKGVLAGFACTCAHHVDMGGRLGATDARDVYEEGVIIPVSKLIVEGEQNDELFRLITRNVRTPEKVMGDLRAQISANHVGAEGIRRMMDEFDLTTLTDLSNAVSERSEQALRSAIATLPNGTVSHEVLHEITDDDGQRLKLALRLELIDGTVKLDFTGTSPQVAKPINAVLNITRAYCVFPFIATLCPDLPMNAGAFRPIEIDVPEGTVLNPTYPAPGMYRSLLSYFTVEVIMGALQKLAPEKVMAPSGTYPLWIQKFAGTRDDGREFVTHFNAQGGQGAFHDRDGVTAVVFPGNIASTSVELFEYETPMLVRKRALTPDSGGPGRHRGGLGQETVLETRAPMPIRTALSGGRFHHPASGMEGGSQGSKGEIRINDGAPFPHSDRADLVTGDRVTLRQPGGGGFGPASERDPASVDADLREGYITAAAATSDYAVAVDTVTGRVDMDATRALRAAK